MIPIEEQIAFTERVLKWATWSQASIDTLEAILETLRRAQADETQEQEAEEIALNESIAAHAGAGL